MPDGYVIARDGLRLAFEKHGHGKPALVFVHGWSCNRSYWKNQIPCFASDFTVVALDLAGHGESDRTRKAWTIESFGADVAAAAEQLRLEQPILIGHSMGGDVIVAAALQMPDCVVQGLVWVDAYKRLGVPRTPERVRAFAAPFHIEFAGATGEFVRKMFPAGADPALVERIAEHMASAPPGIAVPALEAAFSFDREITPALRRLGLKVIAINAEVPPTDVSSLEAFGVSTLALAGVGHFPMLEAPERFNALLKDAIALLRPGRATPSETTSPIPETARRP